MQTLQELLKLTATKMGSDLHLAHNAPPQARIDGVLSAIVNENLNSDQIKDLCYSILTEDQKKRFEKNRVLDFSFSLKDVSRIRANIFYERGNIAAAFRIIPYKIPPFSELGLPERINELTDHTHGLILVTGPTGSGKSTTMASMVDHINETEEKHIITIEDPIEYIFPHKKSLMTQREIGNDANNFPSALKYILRQDPDVVLVGEMRDLETTMATITVAETGHLVLATLHTNTAPTTIDRIIDVFPPHQQGQIRTQLASILIAVLSQQLIPKIGGGRALALEIMIANPAIRNLIRDGKIHQLYSQMMLNREKTGMQTLNHSLSELVRKKQISKEDALKHSDDQEELIKLLP